MRTLLTVLAILGAVSAALTVSAQQLPAAVLPKPYGAFDVGYVSEDLPTGRADRLSSGERILHLEIWYPAIAADSNTPKRLFKPAIEATLAEEFPFADGFAGEAHANAVNDAPVMAGPHPLILLSPGLSFPVSLYQSFAEDLASRGYVVVGVNHPVGVSKAVYETGGEVGMEDWPEFATETDRQKFLAEYASEWTADLESLLAWIAEDSGPSLVASTLDKSSIGILGHSYGGTAAGRMSNDPRVNAVVVLEGAVRDPHADGARGRLVVGTPLLHIIGGYNRLEHEGDQYQPGKSAPVYQAVIDGAGHAELSDLIHLYSFVAPDDWHARRRYAAEPRRVLQIVSDYVAAFFDRYLRGAEKSVLLAPRAYADRVDSPRAAGYPEVDLSVNVD